MKRSISAEMLLAMLSDGRGKPETKRLAVGAPPGDGIIDPAIEPPPGTVSNASNMRTTRRADGMVQG